MGSNREYGRGRESTRNGHQQPHQYDEEHRPAHLKRTVADQLRAMIGTVIGPACIICGDPIDVRSSRHNRQVPDGKVTQGWAHVECQRKAEETFALVTEDEPGKAA